MTGVRAWIAAIRPRTLPAAVAPVLVGTAVAAREGGARPALACAALGAALCLQIGTNLVNDWGDFQRGADGPGRLGPARATQAGWLAPAHVLAGGLAAFALAAALGAGLVAAGGWPVVWIGLASIAAGIAYTAGPFPLAYHGLGEACVFVFFGPVAVCGTALVQAGHVSAAAALASVPVGCLAAAILLVNDVRDVDGDRRAAKRTLVVRIGRRAGRRAYAAAVALAFAFAALLAAALGAPAALLAFLAAPLARAPLRAVLGATDGQTLNAALAATARLHLVFGALLAAGLAW
ncbi:MAG TPA: 1,4-dihydroxy-2-naphthoate polyprenyltransferase [Candidatus Binatia bacterium]|nr:1,4-dihydroxy-2-naphthoate polyprenyltransferase [Candidatus Binatia bacterium]